MCWAVAMRCLAPKVSSAVMWGVLMQRESMPALAHDFGGSVDDDAGIFRWRAPCAGLSDEDLDKAPVPIVQHSRARRPRIEALKICYTRYSIRTT